MNTSSTDPVDQDGLTFALSKDHNLATHPLPVDNDLYCIASKSLIDAL